MKFYLTLIFLLLFTSFCFSQKKFPGYIITTKGDTLKGFIKRPAFFDDELKYTFYDSAGKKQKLKPAEMLGYGLINTNNEQEDYTKFEISGRIAGSDKHDFLKIIIKGNISVFIFDAGTGTSEKIDFYLKTKDEKIYILKEFFGNLGYKKEILKEALAGCPKIVEKISGVLTKKQVLKLINEYNSCDSQ